MSELSERVAREHKRVWNRLNITCLCGWDTTAPPIGDRRPFIAHLAAVTEAAVRETIAADTTAETRTTTTCAGPNAEGEGCPDWWRYQSCAHTITQTRNVTPWKDADA